MEIATGFSGIVALLGVVFTIALVFLLPRIKKNSGALRLGTIIPVLLALSTLGLSVVNLWHAKSLPSTESSSRDPVVRYSKDPHPVENIITTRAYIQQTLSEHKSPFGTTTRSYSVVFEAEAGYRIIEAHIREKGERVSNLEVEKASDGSNTVVRFDLSSGPQFYRYRGWIAADLQLVQEKLPELR